MNDRQNPYDPYYQEPQIVGYDAYGQPVYQQQGQQQGHQQYDQQGQGYDPYAAQPGQGHQAQDAGYGYDAYGNPQQQPGSYDPYAGRHPGQAPQPPQPQQVQGADQGYGYGSYTDYGYATGQQPSAVDTGQHWSVPQQGVAPHRNRPRSRLPHSSRRRERRRRSPRFRGSASPPPTTAPSSSPSSRSPTRTPKTSSTG